MTKKEKTDREQAYVMRTNQKHQFHRRRQRPGEPIASHAEDSPSNLSRRVPESVPPAGRKWRYSWQRVVLSDGTLDASKNVPITWRGGEQARAPPSTRFRTATPLSMPMLLWKRKANYRLGRHTAFLHHNRGAIPLSCTRHSSSPHTSCW
jgi:hypothetical protein